ncbi:MAG: hypothetical protein V2A73_22400 [Pseudomonadota bacterium]
MQPETAPPPAGKPKFTYASGDQKDKREDKPLSRKVRHMEERPRPQKTSEKELKWGPFEVAVWKKIQDFNGRTTTRRSVTLLRHFQHETGGGIQKIWLSAEDIPQVLTVLEMMYEHIVMATEKRDFRTPAAPQPPPQPG